MRLGGASKEDDRSRRAGRQTVSETLTHDLRKLPANQETCARWLKLMRPLGINWDLGSVLGGTRSTEGLRKRTEEGSAVEIPAGRPRRDLGKSEETAVMAGFVGLGDQRLDVLAGEASPGAAVQGTGPLPLRNLPEALSRTN